LGRESLAGIIPEPQNISGNSLTREIIPRLKQQSATGFDVALPPSADQRSMIAKTKTRPWGRVLKLMSRDGGERCSDQSQT
jgi:3-polyprenyl-4-hydroxybenzoate decarboxylase